MQNYRKTATLLLALVIMMITAACRDIEPTKPATTENQTTEESRDDDNRAPEERSPSLTEGRKPSSPTPATEPSAEQETATDETVLEIEEFGFSVQHTADYTLTKRLVDRSTLTTAKLEDTAIATYTLRDPENEQSFFKIDVYARPEHKPLGAPWTNNSDNEIQIGETTLRGYLRNFDDMGFAPDPAIIVPFVDFYVYARSDFTGQDGKVPEKLIEFVKGFGLLPD
ncbi:MAG: hypothetical protein UY05_C0010G0004 [Candidatus Peregrinibacteria bacterium GW2011_GWA2_47_7]|nr:MAG: hypothetical protein UY05_C0010G0004 [Candidatus Peregrinibacteria bacterium GW2011_GWA2_47_7]